MAKFQMPESTPELTCAEAAELMAALKNHENIGSVKFGYLLAHVLMCPSCGERFMGLEEASPEAES